MVRLTWHGLSCMPAGTKIRHFSITACKGNLCFSTSQITPNLGYLMHLWLGDYVQSSSEELHHLSSLNSSTAFCLIFLSLASILLNGRRRINQKTSNDKINWVQTASTCLWFTSKTRWLEESLRSGSSGSTDTWALISMQKKITTKQKNYCIVKHITML